MDNQLVNDVYDTLCGVLIPEARVPGVGNAFAPGEVCDILYGKVMDAYEHLRDRLGVEDEDDDVEVILSAILEIQHKIGCEMYQYGAVFGSARE